ncbi:MAG: BtpA/SgcQ family protein [Halobacteriales archaeon]|nr:BtpA/SgcQ family protein [Halobacteriales archaeon]
MDIRAVFGASAPLVGMVHLPPLPGSPRYDGDREALAERARADAAALADGGVDAVMVENFGDAPFHAEDVPKHVVATMTDLTRTVREVVDLPVGVNVLRNDAEAALSVATAVGAAFVRVNVHTGARVTDQGVIEGRADETMRLRERLGADVAVLADLDVKHSAPLADASYESEAMADTIERGLADGVVVSGSATGAAAELSAVEAAAAKRDALGVDTPVFVGSGVTPETVADYLSVADGAIVGTALKGGDRPADPVDRERVEALVAAAR